MNIMDCEKAGRERSTKSGEEWEGSFAPGRVSFYRMTSESTMKNDAFIVCGHGGQIWLIFVGFMSVSFMSKVTV